MTIVIPSKAVVPFTGADMIQPGVTPTPNDDQAQIIREKIDQIVPKMPANDKQLVAALVGEIIVDIPDLSDMDINAVIMYVSVARMKNADSALRSQLNQQQAINARLKVIGDAKTAISAWLQGNPTDKREVGKVINDIANAATRAGVTIDWGLVGIDKNITGTATITVSQANALNSTLDTLQQTTNNTQNSDMLKLQDMLQKYNTSSTMATDLLKKVYEIVQGTVRNIA